MNIERIDLNLLQTFHAVHGARNVSRAAEQLGVSQPTVSHGLRRLRLLYDDPLFVRTQAGMVPTAKADRLAKAVEHALHILDVAIDEAGHFDPAQSGRTFRLHMSDIGETVFLPPLMDALARRAPAVRLDVFQLDDKDIQPALETGRIDLALGYLPVLGDAVQRQFLLHEKYVVVIRAGHPLARGRPTACDPEAARLRAGALALGDNAVRCRTSASKATSGWRFPISWCCRASWPRPTWR